MTFGEFKIEGKVQASSEHTRDEPAKWLLGEKTATRRADCFFGRECPHLERRLNYFDGGRKVSEERIFLIGYLRVTFMTLLAESAALNALR